MESHGYLIHSKGAWKNHAYLSKKKVNGKWVYYYKNSGGTLQKRQNDAMINKNASPVSIEDSKTLANTRQSQAKTGQLGTVASAQVKSDAKNKGLEYLRRYNKNSDRLPEVQLAKKRAAEEAAAKEAEAKANATAKSTAATSESSGKSSKKTKEKTKKEKTTSAKSSGSGSSSSKQETQSKETQKSAAELAKEAEEQRLKEEREKTEKYVKEASVQELALQVMRGQLGNGQERMDKLGDRYSEVQALVNKLMKTKKLGGK